MDVYYEEKARLYSIKFSPATYTFQESPAEAEDIADSPSRPGAAPRDGGASAKGIPSSAPLLEGKFRAKDFEGRSSALEWPVSAFLARLRRCGR